jgi:signal transduction histidine kinase/FixJ family two-component response regulator
MHPTLAACDATTTHSSTSPGALEFVGRLLTRPPGDQPALATLLAEVAAAFRAGACGLARLPEGLVLHRHPNPAPPDTAWPWQADPSILAHCRHAPGAVAVDRPDGKLLFTTFAAGDYPDRVLWLEGGRDAFGDPDAAALTLAGSALARLLAAGPGAVGARWAEQLDLAARQQDLEAAAAVAGHLAHDFGNVLTSILGFTELALAQQAAANTPLASYLQEVYRAAQNGAQFTQQLRLFSRRQAGSSRTSQLGTLLAEQEARLFAVQPSGLHFRLSVPEDLPPINLDPDQLHQVLTALLDNAREALVGPGAISVSARAVDLTGSDCLDLYGACRPGPHVEVVIADTGQGLSPEVQRRLFTEPFFTSKPKRHGFGLAVAYGILRAHKGGLRLHPGEERGVVARVLLPAATAPAEGSVWDSYRKDGWPDGERPAARPAPQAEGERVLVIDDQPDVLHYVTTALEKAGYRAVGLGTCEAALSAYFAGGDDPFRLVLTDVVMPGMGGVELARQLLRRDPSARVLFMSGHVPSPSWGDFCRRADGSLPPGEMLAKPFRPEQLTKAVRAALDRPAATRPPREPSEGCAPGRAKK